MGIHKELFTNRWLVQVSLLAPFRELKIQCTPSYESQTLEQFSAIQTYYLMDKPVESGWQPTIEENALRAIFRKIFVQELIGCDIPEEQWPDITSFEMFKKFVKTELLILGADFGKSKLVNNEIDL
jgi:hypothetical protein